MQSLHNHSVRAVIKRNMLMNNDKIISNSSTGGNGATQGDQGAGEATAARCAGEAAARRAWKAATGQAWKPGDGGDVQTNLPVW